MQLADRITALVRLGDFLKAPSNRDVINEVFTEAKIKNPWFTNENCWKALSAISETFLTEKALLTLRDHYSLTECKHPKNIGLIMAGNIPAVGFHDLLCTFLLGHKALIKLSHKDDVLIPFLLKVMEESDRNVSSFYLFINRLKEYDAVIATGGNNTSRYFEEYFKQVPHIIRKSRNGIGILTEDVTREEIHNLGKDIFTYFGLGCRNVSKIYVPESFSRENFLEVLHEYNEIIHHHKYKNNFDYNVALFLLNRVEFMNNGCLVIREETSVASRIACLHYEYYKNNTTLVKDLEASKDQLQCIVSREKYASFEHFGFGEAQAPGIMDYADGVDTIAFLQQIDN